MIFNSFLKESKFSFALLLFLTIPIFSQLNNEFDSPWIKPETPIIIDAFYNNSIDWDEMKKDKRVVGILHKATEGVDFVDREYNTRRETAKQKGYKWGSYHLLRKENTIEQAEFYLKTIGKNTKDEIMALDVECTENSPCNVPKYKVSAEEINIFLTHIKKKTGRYPIFYANNSVVKDLSENYPNDEILTKIPLWYARFKSSITEFPKGIWKSYTFWQFSSEINCKPNQECLYRVSGTLSDMDINIYNGTIEELRTNWANIGK
jgi:hypothetical protein